MESPADGSRLRSITTPRSALTANTGARPEKFAEKRDTRNPERAAGYTEFIRIQKRIIFRTVHAGEMNRTIN